MAILALWTCAAFFDPVPKHSIDHDSVTINRVHLKSFNAITGSLIDDHVLRSGLVLVRRRNHSSHSWGRYCMILWLQDLLRCVVVRINKGRVDHESLDERCWAVTVSISTCTSVFVRQV